MIFTVDFDATFEVHLGDSSLPIDNYLKGGLQGILNSISQNIGVEPNRAAENNNCLTALLFVQEKR